MWEKLLFSQQLELISLVYLDFLGKNLFQSNFFTFLHNVTKWFPFERHSSALRNNQHKLKTFRLNLKNLKTLQQIMQYKYQTPKIWQKSLWILNLFLPFNNLDLTLMCRKLVSGICRKVFGANGREKIQIQIVEIADKIFMFGDVETKKWIVQLWTKVTKQNYKKNSAKGMQYFLLDQQYN